MSTREDRLWDMERDRAWVCKDCGRDDEHCDCDMDVWELVEAGTGLNGHTLIERLERVGLRVVRAHEVTP